MGEVQQSGRKRAFAHFAAATDAARMREVLERHLRPANGAPLEVAGCEVTYARRGAVRCLFQYEATLRDPVGGREWEQVVTGVAYGGNRTRRAWRRAQAVRAASPPDRSPLVPAAYVPDLDLLLQVFPFDHQLPALALLTSEPPPALAASLLTRFGPGEWRLEGWDVELVRYRVDLRACLRLTVRAREEGSGQSAERCFFAKVYASAEEGSRARRALDVVGEAVAIGEAPFAVAPRAAYLDDLRILAQDAVAGRPLLDVLRNEREGAAAVRRTARAVAALHRLPVEAPPHRLEREGEGRIGRVANRLRAARPDLAATVAAVEQGVVAGLEALGGLPPAPVHGDLKPAHVLLDGDRVVLLDLDKFAAGEPMLDVANVAVNLIRERGRARRRGGARALTRVFLDEYFAHAPAGWTARFAPHYAAALLNEAANVDRGLRGAVPPPGRRGQADFLLQEAQAALAGQVW